MPRRTPIVPACVIALLPAFNAAARDVSELDFGGDFLGTPPGTVIPTLDPGINTIIGAAAFELFCGVPQDIDLIVVPIPAGLDVLSLRVDVTEYRISWAPVGEGAIVRAGGVSAMFDGPGARDFTGYAVNDGLLLLEVESATQFDVSSGCLSAGEMAYTFTIEVGVPVGFAPDEDVTEGFVLPVGGSGVSIERTATNGRTPPGPVIGPVTYTWRLNGATFDPASIGVEVDGPRLTIVDAGPATAGAFTVTATTDRGSVESRPIYVAILPGEDTGDPADFNNDGVADMFDLLDFLAALAAA